MEKEQGQNTTAQFLGHAYSWPRTKIYYEEFHPNTGGVRLSVHSWGSFFVRFVSPAGKEQQIRIPFETAEKEALVQLFVEEDFLTIAPDEHRATPSESRPVITLRTDGGGAFSVAKWDSVEDERFDRLAAVLKQLIARAESATKSNQRYSNVQLALAVAGFGAMVALPFILAYWASGWMVDQLWATRPLTLLSMLFLLWLFIPLLSGFFRWQEQQRQRGRRIFHNRWVLAAIAMIQVAGIVQLVIFGSMPSINVAPGAAAAVVAFGTVLLGTLMLIPLLALSGTFLLRLVDERF